MKVVKLHEEFTAKPLSEEMVEEILDECKVEESQDENAVNESMKNLEDDMAEINAEVIEEDDSLIEAIKDYRKFAGLEEDCEIGSVDEWALKEAAIKHAIPTYDLRSRLVEETLDDLAREQASIIDEESTKTEIEKLLDRAYVRNKPGMNKPGFKFQAILIEGDAGVGKSNIVEQWIDEMGFNRKTIEAHHLNPEALMGIPDVHPTKQGMVMRRLSTELLEPLKKPNTVLFIDEFNRADYNTRFAFGNLAKYHTMPIPDLGDETTEEVFGEYGQIVGGKLFFNNLIMVVAAQNPYEPDIYTGTNELDGAELERFKKVPVQADPQAVLRYFRKKYTALIKEAEDEGNEEEARMYKGRLALAESLLSSRQFKFSTHADRLKYGKDTKYLSPRTLEDALFDSDGTKEDLLDIWDYHCGHYKKNMVEDILKNYVDIDDKANDALKGGTESSVFDETETPWDTILKAHPNMRNMGNK